MNALVSAVALAAQLAGPGAAPVTVPHSVQAPAPAAAPALPAPTALGTMALAVVAQKQAAAAAVVRVGPAQVNVSVAFPDEDGALQLDQAGQSVQVPFDALAQGAPAELPYGHYTVKLFAGLVEISTPDGALGRVSLDSLMARLQSRAAQLSFDPVVYAVALDGTPQAPKSVALLRQDSEGTYWVAWHGAQELQSIVWLVAIDDAMYGMKLGGGALDFFSEPAPQLAAPVLHDGAKPLRLPR